MPIDERTALLTLLIVESLLLIPLLWRVGWGVWHMLRRHANGRLRLDAAVLVLFVGLAWRNRTAFIVTWNDDFTINWELLDLEIIF